jgi:monothiol glutaredoxin
MSIIDRIKKRLPIVGAGAPSPAAPAPAARSVHTGYAPADEEEPASPRGDKPVREFIDEFVKGNKVVLFMKGTPDSPMCGFSANAAAILRGYGAPIASINVLADPEIRQGIKDYSNWPTIPQVYINGEFLGGSDILMQMHQAGELKEMIQS